MSEFSQQRFSRMRTVMERHVEQGTLPGLVTLVSYHGNVYCDVFGTRTFGGEPMTRDSIFRITSMSKPITAVAAMILVEECVLRLDEPIDRFLPELANRDVLRSVDAQLDDTEPARRPITLRDLLTFRSGLGMVLTSDNYPILQAIDELDVMVGPPIPRTPHTLDEWLRRMGTLPLMYQPGERWQYNIGSDLLAALVARASEQPFDVFLRERIFEPLNMHDTGFYVPADKLGRFVGCYAVDDDTRVATTIDGIDDSQWSTPPLFPTGRDGLVSTIDDYFAFGQMLLNYGTYGNERILSRSSVELMTTNHLTYEQQQDGSLFLDGRGWGFGMAVVTQHLSVGSPVGMYGWDGGFGTSWANDPSHGVVGILMSQAVWQSPSPPTVLNDFWTTAYQALDD